ncbi:recombinase-like helix-turn-helix domain-containing protein [Pararhodobacter marinus]|nr:recombinase-like helix-turn-helix domain-containing protein [Pararhodobacter marinus]
MSNEQQKSRDAFTDVMAAALREPGRAELAHQSTGRAPSAEEHALAEAMMDIYGSGVSDPAAMAKALTERGVKAPVSGRTDWDAALFEAELTAINEAYDAAYAENGIGA